MMDYMTIYNLKGMLIDELTENYHQSQVHCCFAKFFKVFELIVLVFFVAVPKW